MEIDIEEFYIFPQEKMEATIASIFKVKEWVIKKIARSWSLAEFGLNFEPKD
jgi:hypothetical protein